MVLKLVNILLYLKEYYYFKVYHNIQISYNLISTDLYLQVMSKNEKMKIFGVLADEKGFKLDEIPPVPGCITHKIKDYIPCVHVKVNRVGF